MALYIGIAALCVILVILLFNENIEWSVMVTGLLFLCALVGIFMHVVDATPTFLSVIGEREGLIAMYRTADGADKDEYLSRIYEFNAKVTGFRRQSEDRQPWWDKVPLIDAWDIQEQQWTNEMEVHGRRDCADAQSDMMTAYKYRDMAIDEFTGNQLTVTVSARDATAVLCNKHGVIHCFIRFDSSSCTTEEHENGFVNKYCQFALDVDGGAEMLRRACAVLRQDNGGM